MSLILVTGAAGKTGQAVARSLVASGQVVRGLVRRPEQAALVEELGVQEVIIADLRDREAVGQAAAGATAVYHICPNMHPREVLIGEIAIHAARSADIEHFVYHSVLHPQTQAMNHHWQKMRVEEMLFESGLLYTILQPAAYMQNVLGGWERIAAEGIYAVPYALETRLSMVDLQDVAEVVAAVLLEGGHAGATYELCGPDLLSQRQVAAILAVQMGRPVVAEVVAPAGWEQQARSAGLSTYAMETLAAMFRYYEQSGFWGNSRVLGWLLGRSPTTFVQFVQRTLAERPLG